VPAQDEAEATDQEPAVAGREGEGDDPSFAPPAAAGGHGGAALVAEASRVLSTMTSSSYSHKTHIDGTTYDVDCSGFVDYLLARVAPSALDELRAATVKRPLARHFVQFFQAPHDAGHWRRVARVSELAAGDVLAWKKPAEVTSTNTGHVMIVAAAPQLRGGSVWIVPIFDSTAAPHGKSDPRKAAHATGVGRGAVLLEVDGAGAPIAYVWSDAKKSRRHATEIALGRLE
jgi:hypothetical protein